MEKYVLPQNNNSDFKFPASHLPLQQLGQVSILNVSAGRRGIVKNGAPATGGL